MDPLYERCCGLDVHKRQITACLLTPGEQTTRQFGTTTKELLALADWLVQEGCTHVAMEGTGVFWKPVFNLLEGTGLELLVVNAYHIKAVPGRKTDVKDAAWIAQLLQHGLLRASFIPNQPQRELQELVRYRRSLVQERAREINRIEKVLEGANIKLGSVISDLLGVSGRAMVTALADGTTDPAAVAGLAQPRLKATREELEEALAGKMGAHQRLLLTTQLEHIAFLEKQIEALEAESDRRLAGCEEELARLDTIPGVSRRVAQELLAAIGTDMSRFPSAGHLVSWAKLCPGLKESGGKRQAVGTGRGNPYLRAVLCEAAWAASRTKTYLGAQYHRLATKRGKKRAIIAVAHSILVIAYHLLRNETSFADLGMTYFERRSKEATAKRSVRRLERLGYHVALQPSA